MTETDVAYEFDNDESFINTTQQSFHPSQLGGTRPRDEIYAEKSHRSVRERNLPHRNSTIMEMEESSVVVDLDQVQNLKEIRQHDE